MNTHIPPGDNGTKLMNAGILRTYEDRRDATRSAGGFFPPANGTAHALPFSKSFSLAISSFFFFYVKCFCHASTFQRIRDRLDICPQSFRFVVNNKLRTINQLG